MMMEGGEDVASFLEIGNDNLTPTPAVDTACKDNGATDVSDTLLEAVSSQTHADVIPCAVEATPGRCAETEACGYDNTTDTIEVSIDISELVVDQLSRGLLAKIVPDLSAAKTTLSEITENQRILIETVQQENAKFNECQALTDVMDTMEQARLYHSKLVNIKKTMLMMHEKTASLKKRAVRIQQQKQKEALQREQARDRESELERQLTAQPARGSRQGSETGRES